MGKKHTNAEVEATTAHHQTTYLTLPYPWQHKAWQAWQRFRAQLPHALLWHGQAGIGKTDFVYHIAHSALCQHPQANGHPCHQCTACHWFAAGTHPDFRRLYPHEDNSNNHVSKIRLEQILALHDDLQLTPHGHLRVIVLHPANALNLNAANALLKILEEPPPATLFLLVANQLGQVLPTIRSRCQRFFLSTPAPTEALTWLTAQHCPNPTQSLAASAGAPLYARTQPFENHTQRWLEILANPAQLDIVDLSAQWQHLPLDEVHHLLWRWIYDLLQQHICGNRYFFPHAAALAQSLAQTCHATALSTLAQRLLRDRTISTHPLNGRLCIEAWLLDYLAATDHTKHRIRR